MNSAILVVKIITDPVHLNQNQHQILEIEVQFATTLKKNFRNMLNLILWGDHRDDFLKYYKVHDYLVIEGILTSKGYNGNESELIIVAQRMYPLLLD
uniref:hypothetical protein n=1 Tax=Phaeostrophion irregulare TaxID=243268 RepID=UPI002E7A83C8|nr:hypothetical protein V2492_pgp012 [Phaeostrophion irregulare]WAM64374.1 hypothetical protein [Phaeostrophion irregulare]